MSTIHACFNTCHEVDEDVTTQMLAASQYWQPDTTSKATSRNGLCHLAKASLFNSELSKKDSVFEDTDSGDIISANARVDNRSELMLKLSLDEEASSQLTDSQLILKAYQQWGEDCPKHLLGDFVFMIWDESKQQLFSARDHFGVKVLFYAQSSHGLMLSNEHNAFFTTKGILKHFKESWLIRHAFGQGTNPVESPYHDIEVLPPAHSMTMDSQGNIKLSRYWELEDKNDWIDIDDESLIEELKKRFQHAVNIRLNSEYPLAAELSEGLDSNGIVGFAAKMLGKQPLHTLSYRCEQLSDDNRHVWERTYRDIFEMLAMHDNLKPIWVAPQQEEQQRQAMSNFHQHAGGVMAINGGHFWRSYLAQQQGARVLLSGWGGDHCVSTYGDFYESELFSQGKWLATHRLLRNKFKRGRGAKPTKAWAHLLVKHGFRRLYRWLLRQRNGLERAMWQRASVSPLKQSYLDHHNCKKNLKLFTDNYPRYSVKAHHKRELFDVGVEGRLVESELCGRMFRLEYRYPMLDVELVELAYNMPSHLKMFHGTERYMFRKVLEGVTTKRIQWRRKADVDHPQLNREQITEIEQLKQQLQNSDLVKTYCEPSKLEHLTITASSLRELKDLKLLLSVEKQLQESEVKITA